MPSYTVSRKDAPTELGRRRQNLKIDKEKLEKLLKKNDDELWLEVVRVAGSKGLKLPSAPPPKSEMDKMRAAVSHGSSFKLAEAMRIVDKYRKEAK